MNKFKLQLLIPFFNGQPFIQGASKVIWQLPVTNSQLSPWTRIGPTRKRLVDVGPQPGLKTNNRHMLWLNCFFFFFFSNSFGCLRAKHEPVQHGQMSSENPNKHRFCTLFTSILFSWNYLFAIYLPKICTFFHINKFWSPTNAMKKKPTPSTNRLGLDAGHELPLLAVGRSGHHGHDLSVNGTVTKRGLSPKSWFFRTWEKSGCLFIVICFGMKRICFRWSQRGRETTGSWMFCCRRIDINLKLRTRECVIFPAINLWCFYVYFFRRESTCESCLLGPRGETCHVNAF